MTDHTGAFHITLYDCEEPIVEGDEGERTVRPCGVCNRCVTRPGAA